MLVMLHNKCNCHNAAWRNVTQPCFHWAVLLGSFFPFCRIKSWCWIALAAYSKSAVISQLPCQTSTKINWPLQTYWGDSNTTDLLNALTCWLLYAMNGPGYRYCAMAPVGEPLPDLASSWGRTPVGQKYHKPLLFNHAWVLKNAVVQKYCFLKLGLTLAVSLYDANIEVEPKEPHRRTHSNFKM